MSASKKIKRVVLAAVQGTLTMLRRSVGAVLYSKHLVHVYVGNGNVAEFERRLQHFVPGLAGRCRFKRKPGMYMLLSPASVAVLDSTLLGPLMHKLLGHVNLDYEHFANDAWHWFELAQQLDEAALKRDISAAQRRFHSVAEDLRTRFQRVYIFGTGPSLDNADQVDWSNGVRIVSNTIVKDALTWKQVNPHFLVAGDALYHFGHTPFAHQFRADAKRRLAETGTFFLYPALFHSLVKREFADFSERLIPVPYGTSDSPIANLLTDFHLPFLGNVLNQLLLPVATTLSREIFLWGFDGRAPSDQLFWKNSDRHFYPTHVPALQAAHPAFFSHHVPKDNPQKYVNTVHGDALDTVLSDAESKGFRFTLLHKSWTQTLMKRYRDPELCSVHFLKHRELAGAENG
jgi:hypothetical protein